MKPKKALIHRAGIKTKSGKNRLKGLISVSGSLNGSFADSLYEKDDILVETAEF